MYPANTSPAFNGMAVMLVGTVPGRSASSVEDMAAADSDAVRELLRDAFTRLIEHVDDLTEGLTEEVSSYRPTPEANSIAWLLWHSARCQESAVVGHRRDRAGVDPRWLEGPLRLDLPADDIGYGHSPDDVAKVHASAELLAGYYLAVHKVTLAYIAGVTSEDLGRIVDTRWDPPVTASARLVSIIDDCAQHLGQAAYLRGIIP